MSNTVITNYTDLNGPSTKADSSVVVIVNKDGSLSVDQNLLGTLMGTDGSQGAGISVVRVGHEGRPDDATDSESEDDKVPHVTLSVDSYYDEPSSIIKYDSGAEMLQSLRIETRENSLVGFQNDHCYTPLTSPDQGAPQTSDSYKGYDEPVIEIIHTPPPKPVPQSKKITILEQQIIPKGKKIIINPAESGVLLKGNEVHNKSLPVASKTKQLAELEKNSDSSESSSISSGDSIPDRDSDSDYKETKDRSLRSTRKTKLKPRILQKATPSRGSKVDSKITKVKPNKNVLRKDIREKIQQRSSTERKQSESEISTPKENIQVPDISAPASLTSDINKTVSKQTPKTVKKEKKTPAHVSALLSDMTALFSTPDVIRRVSTEGKTPAKSEKEGTQDKKQTSLLKTLSEHDSKPPENVKPKTSQQRTYSKLKDKVNPSEKVTKGFDLIPQLDDASLAQILQDTSGITKVEGHAHSMSAGSMAMGGPLSPPLELLEGEEGLTEDLLLHVAQLVESSENLQEVIDKQVLGKVVPAPSPPPVPATATTTPTPAPARGAPPREIVRRDGRVITLPPIEAPATRSSKRKSQMETPAADALSTPAAPTPAAASAPAPPTMPEPQPVPVSKQYVNKKLPARRPEPAPLPAPAVDKLSAESQESWNSEDDPNRLWCICKQPHNNRFMICCDGCEDWFHGKCVNITKAMGQQMEEQGIEWRCPNCVKKSKPNVKPQMKQPIPQQKKTETATSMHSPPIPGLVPKDSGNRTGCIVCKRAARASSIYCSDACILKHAQDSLGSQTSPSKTDTESGKSLDKAKSDSRVIVYERKSGRLLAGPNAPTAENLKSWLQRNPTFEVVRPGTLHTIKPNLIKKKPVAEVNKIQTTLNFARIPRKSGEQGSLKSQQQEGREKAAKVLSPRPGPEPRPQTSRQADAPRPAARAAAPAASPSPAPTPSPSAPESKKAARITSTRAHSHYEKAPAVSPSTSRRKEAPDAKKRMDSTEPIRENVRKSLAEQMGIRMSENKGPKFNYDEIQQFAYDTEQELYELFTRDVGMKYKAKYRSLIFNIKDRKNLTLWEKICDKKITPQQLVRLSPEEMASQELAQWRDQESKHQLELIKKSELDLLAASKTYVLKTHKGEEVMENKESVQTELDPQVPVEDLVIALNDSTVGEDVTNQVMQDTKPEQGKPDSEKKAKKRERERSSSRHKKSSKESRRESESKKSRSSRHRSHPKEERATRRSEKRSSRQRSPSKERSKEKEKEKEKAERARRRSRSRSRSKSRGKSRRRSRTRTPSPAKTRDRERSRSRRRSSRHSTADTPRSRSQEHPPNTKNDSTDSDSIERPKSAMLKEVHPEYDPHEPMITSAFSEEDLRRSGGEGYDDSYKPDVVPDYGDADFDPTKSFSIDTSVILPPAKFTGKQDRVSEAESDQEPSSTVEHSAATVWNGCINMVDVARFYVAAHEVSGSGADLEEELSAELDVVGRINPDTVWDYIGKMKRAANKDIIVLRLQAANDEEKMQYIALYSYLSSRNRLGVVKVSSTTTVKDLYIVPLAAGGALPAVLQPLRGPGLERAPRSHLLLAVVVRQWNKRPAPAPAPSTAPAAARAPAAALPAPAKVSRESRKRSYTPPMAPTARLPLPSYTSPALSTSVKDKIAASLAAADEEEAYSPGSSSSGSGSGGAAGGDKLRSKMEELNRQIEEQKQQILKMAQADSSTCAAPPGEDEAYSPSRPMTPPVVPLADIALPSNLQEILATIKQRETADVDMRNLPLPPS